MHRGSGKLIFDMDEYLKPENDDLRLAIDQGESFRFKFPNSRRFCYVRAWKNNAPLLKSQVKIKKPLNSHNLANPWGNG